MPHFPKPFYRKPRKLWYVQIDGKQINLGPDKDEAFRQYHQLMTTPKKRRPVVESSSLTGIIDAFLDWVSQNRASETYEWYRYRLQRFIERHADLRCSDLKPFHVETWASSYGLSVTSRRNYLRSVKRCLKWAKKQGYIERNPIADLEVPNAERKEVFISQGEYDTLLPSVRNRSLADLIEVTWETGCRPQESLRVEARHVDIENQRWVLSQSEAKGKKISRVVYLTDRALAITLRLLKDQPSGPLFRNTSGRPWTTEAVNCAFDRIQQRMGRAEMDRLSEAIPECDIIEFMSTLKPTKCVKGVDRLKREAELRHEAKQKLTNKRAAELAPRYSLYALRHSWATRALQRGVDPLTVAILMGHKDPSTLSKVYQHLSLSPEHMLQQAKKAAG